MYLSLSPVLTLQLQIVLVTDYCAVSAILHPHCVEKAQSELDAIVGRSRMPTFDDEPSLPYVRAMINESLRWRVVAPIGLAHATTREDTYMGYRIPKGATVWGNIKYVKYSDGCYFFRLSWTSSCMDELMSVSFPSVLQRKYDIT